jgi:hypothetical protein
MSASRQPFRHNRRPLLAGCRRMTRALNTPIKSGTVQRGSRRSEPNLGGRSPLFWNFACSNLSSSAVGP